MSKSLLCLLLLLPSLAAAQSYDDEYYPFAVREEPQPMIVTDTTLFYRAVQVSEDAYGRITDFNLPQVSLRRRGQAFAAGTSTYCTDSTSAPPSLPT